MTIFLLAIIALLLAAIVYGHYKHIDAFKEVTAEVQLLRALWEKAIADITKHAP